MPWFNLSFSDFIKKRVCKFLINRYLGQFFEEKLTADQICLDLYNGKGSVFDVRLCCEVKRVKEYFSNYQQWTDDYYDKQFYFCIHKTSCCCCCFNYVKTCFLFAISFVFLPIKWIIDDCMSDHRANIIRIIPCTPQKTKKSYC